MRMKLAVSANVASIHLFPLPRSRIRSRRAENLLAMFPAVSAVRANTMLSPVNTRPSALNSEVRAWATVMANVSGSGCGLFRSITVASTTPTTVPRIAVISWLSATAVRKSSSIPRLFRIVVSPRADVWQHFDLPPRCTEAVAPTRWEKGANGRYSAELERSAASVDPARVRWQLRSRRAARRRGLRGARCRARRARRE